MAFPFSELSKEPVINAQVGDLPLLVLFDAANASGVVYSRQSDERALTFEAISLNQLRDLETGSLWDPFVGEAVDGPLTGVELERVKSTTSFWFGWKDFHPETMVYGGG